MTGCGKMIEAWVPGGRGSRICGPQFGCVVLCDDCRKTTKLVTEGSLDGETWVDIDHRDAASWKFARARWRECT